MGTEQGLLGHSWRLELSRTADLTRGNMHGAKSLIYNEVIWLTCMEACRL
jgi:hypothetical protein